MKNSIVPALMSINPFDLAEALIILDQLEIECLHADVLDGEYTPSISMGPNYFSEIARRSRIPTELHLQISDPFKHLNNLNHKVFSRIILHNDKIAHNFCMLEKIGSPEMKLGIAINPEESIDVANNYVTNSKVDKITALSKFIANQNLPWTIQVDAGVRKNNIQALKLAGATEFVCASALFAQGDIRGNFLALLEEIKDEML